MDKEKMMKLYELTIQEAHYFLTNYENKVIFFWKIISTIFAGIIFGIFKATHYYHFVVLSIAPILLFFIASIAKKALHRDYLNFLECVTMRAKIESNLELDDKSTYSHKIWEQEPIIPLRYNESRKTFESSEKFINNAIELGLQKVYNKLFSSIKIISVLMLVSLMFLSWQAHHQQSVGTHNKSLERNI